MSIPRKHHFIPAFYQRAWTDTEGTLVEYSRPRDIVKCRPKTPASTGWERDLYAFPELPPEAAQHIEAQFFQYADDVAAQALANLLAGNKVPWTIESRSAWSRFLIAIHVRHPDAMKELRPAVRTIWDDSAEASQREYDRTRQPHFPPTFDEYWAQRDPLLPIKVHVNMIIKALDNETVGAHINGMYWYVLDVSKSSDRLLTSDRPVELSQLRRPTGVAAIPISPTQLFVAANDMSTIHNLIATNPQDVVRNVNTWIVSRARRYVYSNSEALTGFIEGTMSTNLEKLPLFPNLARVA
jgi:hypothetical protein